MLGSKGSKKSALKKAMVFFMGFLFLSPLFSAPSFAKSPNERFEKKKDSSASISGRRYEKKVVMILIDRVGFTDCDGDPMCPSNDTPFLSQIASDWSSGAMVSRSYDSASTAADERGGGFLTIGAGTRAAGAKGSGLCFSYEDIKSVKLGSGGFGEDFKEERDERVNCLSWGGIERANKNRSSKDYPGTLGELLESNGLKTGVVGNSDTYYGKCRLAPLICADKSGFVEFGNVGNNLSIRDPQSPGGYVVDVKKILDESRSFLEKVDFLVVDTGDTARVDRQFLASDEPALEKERLRALRRADVIAGGIAESLDLSKSLLIIVSPTAPRWALMDRNYLTPCFIAGPDFSSGALSSRSTRRKGIINNTDITATILSFFGLKSEPEATGLPVFSMKQGDSSEFLEDIRALYRQLPVTRRARWPIVIGCLVLGLISLCFSAIILLRNRKRKRLTSRDARIAALLRFILLVLSCFPLSFLLASLIRFENVIYPAVFTLVLSVILAAITWLFLEKKRFLDPFAFVCLLTLGVIVLDMFSGSRLPVAPLLGASVLEGMRFFGLPNAFVALLISVSVWGVAFLMNRPLADTKTTRYLSWFILCAISFIVGLGGLGANIGGFIAALSTYIFFMLALSRKEFDTKLILKISAAVLASVMFMLILDFFLFHSHAERVAKSGISGIFSMISNKIQIHVGEFSYLPTPAILMVFCAVIALLLIKSRKPFVNLLWNNYLAETSASFSILVGGLVALVFNDSGISMLAIMILVSVLALLYRALAVLSRRE
ncbi:MAG: hypothetical protein PHP64_03290 [Actinomycetota bacterium]|nr:hypothetical protein [Actinomycetota bacterium]